VSGPPGRAADGPLVSDEQLHADLEYVDAGLRSLRFGDLETEVFDAGTGDPVLFVPILGHVEVIYARQQIGRASCRERV